MVHPRRSLLPLFLLLKRGFASHPVLKTFTLRFLMLFPGLKHRLRRIGNPNPYAKFTNELSTAEQLPVHAREIYFQLKDAIVRNQKEHV